MYEKFYGLTKEPFQLTPDPEICFEYSAYRKAKSYMQYALHSHQGVVLVTGRPGSGKSLLVSEFVATARASNLIVARVIANDLEGEDLLRLVLVRFGLRVETEYSEYKSALLLRLEEYLIQARSQGQHCLLVIDEAQTLSLSALEELRGLTNLTHKEKPLMQLFLVGQSKLRDKVLSPELEQLHQRITASCHLTALSAEETEEYISHRLMAVGWKNNPELAADICGQIHRASLGIPRWINLICTRLFLHGMVEKKNSLNYEDLYTVLSDLKHEDLLPSQSRINPGDRSEEGDLTRQG